MTSNKSEILKRLQEIISLCGPPSDEKNRKYNGYLSDYFVHHDRELNLLKIILDQGFVTRLAKENNSVPYEMLVKKYVAQLHDNWGMDESAAKWAIDTWAEALGVYFTISCKADFIISHSEGVIPLSVTFQNQSQGLIDRFEWDFGDGEGSPETNPTHEFLKPGKYSVILRAYNKDFVSEYSLNDAINVFYPKLKADFSVQDSEGEVPFIVTVKDNSQGFIQSYEWDFGDGSRSNEKNPSHDYNTPGNYQITLTVSDGNTSDTYVLETPVKVFFPPLTPKFGCSLTEGVIPFSIQFTDLSKGMISSRRWDFGDGITSDKQNPVHEYNDSGMFTVTLTIKDEITGEEQSKAFAITALLPRLTSDFDVSNADGQVPLSVSFLDKSEGKILSHEWDFGDGEKSSEQNPVHTYTKHGRYSVSLTVKDKEKSEISCKKQAVIVRPQNLNADFSSSIMKGDAPLSVLFTPKYINDSAVYHWSFGDGEESDEQKPTHIYKNAGKYPVRLSVSLDDFIEETISRSQIKVYHPQLIPDFNCSVTEGIVPFSIECSDLSKGMVGSWRWEFDDGTTSDEQNPVHEFTDSGTYNVTLTIRDAVNGKEIGKTISITAALPPLVSDFDVNNSDGQVPLSVSFFDKSQGKLTFYEWDFGDGERSNDVNPVHVYTKHGRFSVTLTVRDKEKSHALMKKFAVIARPEKLSADFSCSVTKGDAPLSVDFFPKTTGPEAIYRWFFGDGEESYEQNPVHIYKKPGKYSVKLTVKIDDFSEEKIIENLVVVSHPPLKSEFRPSKKEGVLPLFITFTDLSTGLIGTWRWDFGDGTTSEEQNPVHEYTDSEIYTVKLTIQDEITGEEQTKEATITALLPPLVADFEVENPEGLVPLSVTCNSRAEGKIISYEWDFGDGETSNEENPVHTYTKHGKYSVSLTVKDKEKSEFSYKDEVVIARPAHLNADFSCSINRGVVPLSVDFTPNGINPNVNYHWEFGDGTTSEEQNPVHIYQEEGEYSVRLIASEDGFSEEEVKTGVIVVYPPMSSGFTCSVIEGVIPFSVQFSDLSKGMIDSWRWDFGDGTISDERNPVHEYSDSGTFTVTLTIIEGITGLELSKTISIKALLPPLVSDFTLSNSVGQVPLSVHFFDNSKGKIISYEWDFGDGEKSIDKTPVHTYKKHGKFSVSLTVKDKEKSESSTKKQIVIARPNNLNADFTHSPGKEKNPLSVCFNPVISNPNITYHWVFGDGGEADTQNPVHTYQKAGNYSVQLTVSEDDFFEKEVREIKIKPVIFSKPIIAAIFGVLLIFGALFLFMGTTGNLNQDNLVSNSPGKLILPANVTIESTIKSPSSSIPQESATISNEELIPPIISPGEVTIDANGSNPYRWGSIIELSGINTISNDTYLYYSKEKGGNSKYNGGMPNTLFSLTEPSIPADLENTSSYSAVSINQEDKTWKYYWNTSFDEFERMNGYVYAFDSPKGPDVIPNILNEQKIPIIIGTKSTTQLNFSVDSSDSGGDSF